MSLGPAATALAPVRRWRGRTPLVVAATVAFLVLGIIASAMIGQLSVTPTEVIGAILKSMGIDTAWTPEDPVVLQALWYVRFPRIVMAILVGAALSVAGAVMQVIFGNPLAEPGVVGISAGGALGAAIGIVLGITVLGPWTLAVFAFAGALGATILVYSIARSRGRTEVVTLLLTGIAVNAFAGAGLAAMLFIADSGSREQIVFWQLGSLNGSRWPEAGIVALATAVGLAYALSRSRQFDLLALGERNARHLGLDVERLRLASIVVVAILTGAAVAFVGIIAFVGLVVPHLVRMIAGPSSRGLLIGSALGGALLMVLADLLARSVVTGADLPIGLLTSIIGGPFFFAILARQRAKSGGWA